MYLVNSLRATEKKDYRVAEFIDLQLEYVQCLTSMMLDIAENQWPSRDQIALAVDYARALGLSAIDIDSLKSLADFQYD